MRSYLWSVFFLATFEALATDSDFFSHRILQQYEPRSESPASITNSPSTSFSAENIAQKIETIWGQSQNRLEQNGNAAWETDFVTQTKDPKLNQMVYENKLSPEQYEQAVQSWAEKYQRGVVRGPQTLKAAGERILQAGQSR